MILLLLILALTMAAGLLWWLRHASRRTGKPLPSVSGTPPRFEDALRSYQQKDFAHAEGICQEILSTSPRHSDAIQLLANIALQRSRPAAALNFIDQIIAINPKSPDAHFNRGVLFQILGRLSDALDAYDRTLELKSDYLGALINRGTVLIALQRLDEALASYDRALALKEDYPEVLVNRGNLLLNLNRADQALASYNRALALKPDFAEALYNRGNAFLMLRRPEEALASYDRSLQLQPNYIEALIQRGNTLLGLKRPHEALVEYDRALHLRPDHVEALHHRGNACAALKRREEALASYDLALKIEPDYPELLSNRGNVLLDLKRLEEARQSFDRALQLRPDFPQAHHNRGYAALLMGDLQRGWVDYEWRWKEQNHPEKRPEINAKEWQGEDLSGRSIVLFHEQALGDVIQFSRYLPFFSRQGAKVTLLAPARLVRLLRTLDAEVEIVTAIDPRAPFDFQCALMSVPLRFKTDLTNIPNNVPYLKAEEDLKLYWKEKLGRNGFKVGIAWHGSLAGHPERAIPLAEFYPLSQIDGVRLVSLQKGDGVEELQRLPAGMTVEILGEDFDSGPDGFIDAAAVISNLDLVISSDTSIAHLAGALACPTWLALKFVPDWRWLVDRSDSPWYPTMRLCRQQTNGDWAPVIANMAQQLRVHVMRMSAAAS